MTCVACNALTCEANSCILCSFGQHTHILWVFVYGHAFARHLCAFVSCRILKWRSPQMMHMVWAMTITAQPRIHLHIALQSYCWTWNGNHCYILTFVGWLLLWFAGPRFVTECLVWNLLVQTLMFNSGQVSSPSWPQMLLKWKSLLGWFMHNCCGRHFNSKNATMEMHAC